MFYEFYSKGGHGMQTIEVFGVSKEMVKSYIERPEVNGKFLDALKEDKHIVVYGSSKQGKSALVEKHIRSDEKITVNASPKMSTKDIYTCLLYTSSPPRPSAPPPRCWGRSIRWSRSSRRPRRGQIGRASCRERV